MKEEVAVSERPNRIDYYLGEAIAIAARAECAGQHVGAVIVGSGNRVLSTGYNGAPEGWGNCSDGGVCPRCDLRAQYGSGNAYDKCICVHAEMNAIAAAARYGMALDGATAYVTHQPCFTCAKELVQAGIATVYYGIALPVGEAVPAGRSEERRAEDLYLKRTEARLLGELRAVHVKNSEGAVRGLRRAMKLFAEERHDSVTRAQAAREAIDSVIALEKAAANGATSPVNGNGHSQRPRARR
jgi:Deoxycytidylate deaminase